MKFGAFCQVCARHNVCARNCGNAVFFSSSGLCKPCGTAALVPSAEQTPHWSSSSPNLMSSRVQVSVSSVPFENSKHRKICHCNDVRCSHTGSVCGVEIRTYRDSVRVAAEKAQQAGLEYDYDCCADCNSVALGIRLETLAGHLCTCPGSAQGCKVHAGVCGRHRLLNLHKAKQS